jgi:integrase
MKGYLRKRVNGPGELSRTSELISRPDRNGTRHTTSKATRSKRKRSSPGSYRDLLRRQKLSGPNFHALRHSYASQLLRSGVDIKIVSARLSRSIPTLTYYLGRMKKPCEDRVACVPHRQNSTGP